MWLLSALYTYIRHVDKVIYFASDFHLGLDWIESSQDREKRIVHWLKDVAKDADEIHLVGDLFDFWYEYKKVVPRGFTRLLGCLAELADRGIDVHIYRGNHDMWMKEYLVQEIGATIHDEPYEFTVGGKRFYVHHGDKVKSETKSFKFLRSFFDSKICQWLFHRLHPNLGMFIGQQWSIKSRNNHPNIHPFNLSSERLIVACEEMLRNKKIDYFICGHRHLPIDHVLSNGTSRYINLGDWFYHAYGYASFKGANLTLYSATWESFENNDSKSS